MADSYWSRQPPNHAPAPTLKRPRTDFDFLSGAPSGQENSHYLPRDENRAGFHALKDTKSIEESYERYLQNAQRPSSGLVEGGSFSGIGVGKGVGGGMPGGMYNLPYGDSVVMGGSGPRGVGPDMISNGRGMGFGGELPVNPMVRPGPPNWENPMVRPGPPNWENPMVRPGPPNWEMSLPPDASNTLFVEGLPRGITPREVAHIFRPFLGYEEVRIVTKEPKFNSADHTILCFVDFTDASSAMTAINALQGYKVDEKDPNSPYLRMQFSRFPGQKAGSGPRGRKR